MTGYTVHTGSNDNFREGWDNIFGGNKKKPTSQKKTATGKKASTSKQKKTKKK